MWHNANKNAVTAVHGLDGEQAGTSMKTDRKFPSNVDKLTRWQG
jgi:hypothetical protein